ncbi:MAG: UDP-N-acetylglucosamine 1-carboxyvinyltransferase [Bacteroidetes bacterium]|nr:UDP-N-acetylglucosamine 1-carboxyvinyltransferase [Bacteroidota bacterium]
MDKFVIEGGKNLRGTIAASGSKNASLPLMAASLLARGTFTIHHTPDLQDVHTLSNLLRIIGCRVQFTRETQDLLINTEHVHHYEAPYELVKKMRASIYVLGPLLARYGYARVSLPGGCAWGPRPVDLHIEGMKQLGAEVDLDGGYIIAKKDRLVGNRIKFPISSVGATGNVLMAAVLAKGESLIENAAIEPEIVALEEFLVAMGAKIQGVGTRTLTVQGVDSLYPTHFNNIPDRIEIGTFMVAAGLTRGDVTITNVIPDHIRSVADHLEQSGCRIEWGTSQVRVTGGEQIRPVNVITDVFPGFPTDMQAQWIAYMTQANGPSTLVDQIYFDRWKHVPELERLNARLKTDGNACKIEAPAVLKGATVMSTDLRASATLILAGLVAKGTTEVLRVYHLDRGYESLEKKLAALGAGIRREHYEEFSKSDVQEES